MGKLKVGAFLSSFVMDFKSSMAKAEELNLVALEFAGVAGEINVFEPISDDQAEDIKAEFAKRNMLISSICGEVGGFAVLESEEAQKKTDSVRVVMDNAVKIGCKIIQLHIGKVEEDKTSSQYMNLTNSLITMNRDAKERDLYVATETGPESGATLGAYIRSLNLERIKVNFDPANLCMCGFDEVQSVYDLSDLIIQTHAKDGIRGSSKDGYIEVPLGEGDVRWTQYLKALEDIGFDGCFIIERECGETPVDDISMAARFLQNQG